MTMGHRTDFPILRAILARPLETAYLGVIGSRAKRQVLVRELAEAGIAAGALDRLRCPIGLPIGGNQPGEIAVSVVAEILQLRDAAERPA
jgi:xanthine dehydrogenase accessory factor